MRIQPHLLSGTLNVPASKSIVHRAIIAASLARGQSTITHVSYSQDLRATIAAMKALGAIIEEDGTTLTIDGTFTLLGNGGTIDIDCAESGSTLRFMIPIALTQMNKCHFTGQGRLGERPLDFYYDLFERLEIGYFHRQDVLDLYVAGQLRPGLYEVPGNVSSQYVSGLLFALPLLEGDSRIVLTTRLESASYVDLTLDILALFGIVIIKEETGFYIRGNQRYQPRDYQCEADFSQAAFFLGADALGSLVTLRNLNMASHQGDKAIIDYLTQMGASLVQSEDGVSLQADDLHGIMADASMYPDLMPALAVVMALAKGKSQIVNAMRLRFKECDRLHAICEVLRACGVPVEEGPSYCVIEGVSHFTGAHVSSYHDHRIAMMIAMMATQCEGDLIMDHPECVQKSYPAFFNDYVKLGGIVDECELGD